jgi:cytoskeletal protein RodZ
MDSENLTSADTAPELPLAAAPGARLREAREALRVELTHIAAETRIPLRHLEAIEAGNFESLPSRAYAIGFSRTFAKAVGLDDDEITEAVRAELADGSMRRTQPSSGMEPGDPARLPSKGLAWASGAAVLVLAIGAFAFYSTYFGAGTEPGPLLAPEPAKTAAPVAAATAPAANGPVVLTAAEDGIWVRLYEEGGERLAERTLKQGETLEVPAAARDPRINTGRPDALTVTVGGQPVAKLAERAQTISGAPVSAAALLARAAPAASPDATTPAASGEVPIRRPTVRRVPAARAPVTEPSAAAPAGQPEVAAPLAETVPLGEPAPRR